MERKKKDLIFSKFFCLLLFYALNIRHTCARPLLAGPFCSSLRSNAPFVYMYNFWVCSSSRFFFSFFLLEPCSNVSVHSVRVTYMSSRLSSLEIQSRCAACSLFPLFIPISPFFFSLFPLLFFLLYLFLIRVLFLCFYQCVSHEGDKEEMVGGKRWDLYTIVVYCRC